LNCSATEIRSLALPGHSFRVVALDGNPVPNPSTVSVLWLGTAERISAIVEIPGLKLFHCHQQLHVDYGFMSLFDYV
jgi:FtsP/CotA-like multicopper oxidase with cupredoxin domain